MTAEDFNRRPKDNGEPKVREPFEGGSLEFVTTSRREALVRHAESTLSLWTLVPKDFSLVAKVLYVVAGTEHRARIAAGKWMHDARKMSRADVAGLMRAEIVRSANEEVAEQTPVTSRPGESRDTE